MSRSVSERARTIPAGGRRSGGARPPRVLLLFIDGVGLGDADPSHNAFVVARMPVLTELLEGRKATRAAAPWHGARASLVAVDATLGVPGLPQSGTGQSALLTGRNTPRSYGRHFGPWVPTSLRPLVRDESVLALAKAAGRSIAFANAVPEELIEQAGPFTSTMGGAGPPKLPRFLHAGPPLAALGAGVLDRGTTALARGDAVASEITNDAWRERLGRSTPPRVDAATAGHNLARIASPHDFTLFAHYSTDHAGHERRLDRAVSALERVDAFLGGLLERLDDALLLVVSDHGNLEDARRGHTLNPALGVIAGPGHAAVAGELDDLTRVTPVIMRVLGATR